MKIVAYHGSGTCIDEFKYEFTNQGNDELGSGFYFTTDIDEAKAYCTRTISGFDKKLGGDENPTLHVVELTLNNPLKAHQMSGMSLNQIVRIIKDSPILEEALENFGEVGYEPLNRILMRAAEGYVIMPREVETIKNLNKISKDIFGEHIEAFNRAVKAVMGWDGIEKRWTPGYHYVAWFPEQIEIIERIPLNSVKRKCGI